MNANGLIDELNWLVNVHGDLDVYIHADHGQTPEGVFCIQVMYIVNNDPEHVIGLDDLDENDEEDLEKIILIN